MILLNFKGTKIKGTATVDGHKDWITVDALQMAVYRGISSSGGGDRDPSTPNFTELSLSRATDPASPDLFMQAVCGISMGDAEIDFIQTGGSDKKQQVYLKLVLGGAIINSYSVSSNGERPVENLTINFTTINYTFSAFSGDAVTSNTKRGWNLQDGQSL
ncbi:type VI secretion system secreted protein Hcp [Pseudomonas grimontii]|uniref:Type VI secretion system secreted protein Hcp n=1 Tax=Pseudomonas grimontii TaxID=129847 RepID=A0A1H1G764_9PSED|nr:type VI secretion system tube protein Hcp [Pseudomonas grimontii]TWR67720.1 type VI secretion system tube protein Hcp [Pseudomonas grimontii]SDR09047.1 type VI secretion system secreted protein Hcp [Pseudomonas grimontii]